MVVADVYISTPVGPDAWVGLGYNDRLFSVFTGYGWSSGLRPQGSLTLYQEVIGPTCTATVTVGTPRKVGSAEFPRDPGCPPR